VVSDVPMSKECQITFVAIGEGRLTLSGDCDKDLKELFKAFKSSELLALIDSFEFQIINIEELASERANRYD
jgi:hypothetical protein